MRQQSLTDGFEKHCMKTRKEWFLEEIDETIPTRLPTPPRVQTSSHIGVA